MAYSPKTRLLYIPANENLCATIIGQPVTYTPGERFTGAPRDDLHRPGRRPHRRAAGVEHRHRAEGVEPALRQFAAVGAGAGDRRAAWCSAGGTNDRYFRAFDATNGKVLWEFRTGSGVNGVPSPSPSTASSTSPCNRAGGSMPRACKPASTSLAPANTRRCRKAARSGSLQWTERWRRRPGVSAAAKQMVGRQLRLQREREWLLARIAEKPDLDVHS